MTSITVKNASGQVVSLNVDGPRGLAVAGIVEQRIKRGELEKVSTSTKSATGPRRNRAAVVDADTGVRDEKGDLLKSVHGGGIDPDAKGDALGRPTGSEPVEGAIEVNGQSEASVQTAGAKPASEAARKAAKSRAEHQS